MRFLKKMKINKKENYKCFPNLEITLTQSFLSQKSPFLFTIDPDKNILKNMANKLEILKLSNFKCFGEIEQIKNDNFKFKCFISCHILQKCIISLELMRVKISTETKRTFIFKKKINSKKDTSTFYNDSDEDIDYFEDKINLEKIITEILNLEIPNYPRIPGKKFKDISITKNGIEAYENLKINPFFILEKLKKR
tara:strand:+ start:881 stop:1465 length:585 start_codon:yes stop_codon:yes gene_type:complete